MVAQWEREFVYIGSLLWNGAGRRELTSIGMFAAGSKAGKLPKTAGLLAENVAFEPYS